MLQFTYLLRMKDATFEAMKIVINFCYGRKPFDKKDISNELLEEVLILAHYFDLQELVYLATSQISYMVMNPRLRFSVRRHNEDLKKWLDFAIRQQIYYRGSPTYTKITNTVSTNTVFGLCTCKWGN